MVVAPLLHRLLRSKTSVAAALRGVVASGVASAGVDVWGLLHVALPRGCNMQQGSFSMRMMPLVSRQASAVPGLSRIPRHGGSIDLQLLRDVRLAYSVIEEHDHALIRAVLQGAPGPAAAAVNRCKLRLQGGGLFAAQAAGLLEVELKCGTLVGCVVGGPAECNHGVENVFPAAGPALIPPFAGMALTRYVPSWPSW